MTARSRSGQDLPPDGTLEDSGGGFVSQVQWNPLRTIRARESGVSVHSSAKACSRAPGESIGSVRGWRSVGPGGHPTSGIGVGVVLALSLGLVVTSSVP